MAKVAKIEVKIEIKSSTDKFYDFFRYNMKQLVNLSPEMIQGAELLEGDENSVGSVSLWKYVLGSPMTVKTKIEAIDDENKSITYSALEGDIMKMYKSFTSKLEVTEENGVGHAKWSLEFEKAYEEVPNPQLYADFAAKVSEGLDAYLHHQL